MDTYELRQARPVAMLGTEARSAFIARTYAHLFGAIVAFTLFEIALFKSGSAEGIARAMLGGSWLLVLGAFLIVGWVASAVAARARSLPAQYAALGGYVLAEAIVFVPLLYLANHVAPGAIASAAFVTLLGFTGLTGTVFFLRKDFSFLGALLRWAGICAVVLIVASVIFGFQLGTLFSVGMVALAGGAILYETSNVVHHYPVDRHVSASLQLFASVALLFWYVLRLFLSSRD